MCGILQRIFDAARERDCPIVHVAALEGEAPFVASTPCLGDRPTPLIEITADQYLGLMAEIGLLAVEYEAEVPTPIRVRGIATGASPSERPELVPRTVVGHLRLPLHAVAVQYMLDSYGQETTIVYCGLGSFGDIKTYWRDRAEVYRAFVARYSCDDVDRYELLRHLDHTVHPGAFDVRAFAAQRGLSKTVCDLIPQA